MERNAYFDNAKVILIFLVVFGHAVQPFTAESDGINTLYVWIYTFHMPAFIFIAGFFAKGSGNFRYILRLLKKFLIPYLIFQSIYTGYYFLIGKSNWLTDHIFYPHWSLWFLVSLFCWHLLLIVYRHMPFYIGIPVALLIGIIIGYFDHIEHTFSLSRTFVFFPFFLLGYSLKEKHIMALKRTVFKRISLLTLFGAAIAIYYLPDFNYGWLLASKSYSSLGLDYFGGVARLTVYSTSFIMAASVFVWIPERRMNITVLGERTLYVYLLHGFIIQLFRQYPLLEANNLFDIVGIAIISAAIVLLLSNRFIVSLWQPLVELDTSRLKGYFRKLRYD